MGLRSLAALAAPLLGLVVLLAVPVADVRWQHPPSHFWLVLAAAGVDAAVAVAIGDAGRRRGDARLFLVSLAFFAAGAFLGLHALATPGVLLASPNQGFAIAMPVGLLLASVLAVASVAPLGPERAAAVMRRAGAVRGAVVAVVGVWAAASLLSLPPLDDAPVESGSLALVILAVPAIALFVLAAVRYLGLGRAPLVLAVAAALVLLAEAMVAVALARNWHASWWEWHGLMLAAFVLVAVTARRAPPSERFGDLYLPATADATRELTVLFSDLAGFTTWAEAHPPAEVSAMLDAHLALAQSAIVREGGELDRVMGDAVLATFNTRGDRPDHPGGAARAALALRRGHEALTSAHPGWPALRIGVNTGAARVGVLGSGAGRTFTVIGDAVNVASRLQTAAPPGEIAVSAASLAALDGARTRPLGWLALKGRREEVEAHLLLGLAPAGAPVTRRG